jgi:hypothetical protein
MEQPIPQMGNSMNSPMPPEDDNQPPMGDKGDESEFDTGFDAGIEADEDEDPKKFIQQLTGKLSQSLNSYNNEQGDDEELSKYVGKMIVKAAAKALDANGKKDLIKSINTTDSDEDDEDLGDDENEEPMDSGEDMGDEQLQEHIITKGEIKKLMEEFNQELQTKPKNNTPLKEKPNKKKTAFSGKRFK